MDTAFDGYRVALTRAMTRRALMPLAIAMLAIACSGTGSMPTAPTPPSPPVGSTPPTQPPVADPAQPPPTPAPSPPPTISRSRFLAFGDSITAGTTSPVFTSMGAGLPESYPYKLVGLLQARYTGQTFTMENEGKPAETAQDGSARLPPLLRSIAPEIVILLEGVNDITGLGTGGVTKTASYLNVMAHDARLAGAQVVLCTLLPQRAGGLRTADPVAVASYNTAIRDIARGEGAILVDFDKDFGDLSLIGADGLHPTEAGYTRMAQMVFDTLRTTFETPATH